MPDLHTADITFDRHRTRPLANLGVPFVGKPGNGLRTKLVVAEKADDLIRGRVAPADET